MGDGEAAPHEFVDRVAEPELQIVTLGEFSERLGEKHQSLAVEAQPGEQRLVEDENHRQARIEREGRIGRAQRLCGQPDSVGRGVGDDLVRSGEVDFCRPVDRDERRLVGPGVDRAGVTVRAALAQPRRSFLDLPAAEAVGLVRADAGGPLPAESVGRPGAVE